MKRENYRTTEEAKHFLELQGFRQSPHFKRGFYKPNKERAVIIALENHYPDVTVWYHGPVFEI